MPVDLSAYRVLYVKTASDLVGCYAALMHRSDSCQELHRIFHSLKGQSLAMGYKTIGAYFYLLELFYAYRMEHAGDMQGYPQLPMQSALNELVKRPDDGVTLPDWLASTISEWRQYLVSLGIDVKTI